METVINKIEKMSQTECGFSAVSQPARTELQKRFKYSEEFAAYLRIKVLHMIAHSCGSHIGSAFSIADILAVLYSSFLKYDPADEHYEKRDRFILSKGHAGACLYAALATVGFFPETLLENYCDNGSILSGHISHHNVPGVEFSTGSLGHGFPVAVGMSYSLKQQGRQEKTVVLMGDGECNEGTTWESALFAATHNLNNLLVIVDRNHMQALGDTEDIMKLEPLQNKWEAFGWQTYVVDGHDHAALKKLLENMPFDAPACIIAETVKGKGVSFMEKQLLWHYRNPAGDFYDQALKELEGALK